MIQAAKLFPCRKALGPLRLVFVNVEYGEQFGDEQNISHPLAQVRQLHLTTLIPDGGERSHQSTHTSTVDVGYIRQIDEDVLVSPFEQLFDLLAQSTDFVPDNDLALGT